MEIKNILQAVLTSVIFACYTQSSVNAQTISGSCSGTVTQFEKQVSTYPVKMELSGTTGTINYPSLGCGGTLTFIKSDDSVYFYKEHITSGIGNCIDGGTIEIVLRKNTINWFWYIESYQAYANLNGKLSIVGLPTKRVPVGYEGFTHKWEAKNQMKDGLKEGKWIIYLDSFWLPCDSNKAAYYRLTQFKAGKIVGLVCDYYISGRLQNDYVFTPEGKHNGMAKWYYESGELSLVGSFTDSLRQGPYIWYYANGNPQEILFYDKGQITNTGLWFYEDGKIKAVIPQASGVRDGLAKWYYENGKLKEADDYTAGRLNGMLKTYSEDGTPTAEISYADDQKDGSAKWYFSNGKLQENRMYSKGKLEGKTYVYSQSGTLLKDLSYSNDELNGECKWYYESGVLEADQYLTSGKLNGTCKWYYENGNLKKNIYYVSDQPDGVATFYFESGVLDQEDSYSNGVQNGWTKWYYESGKLKEEAYYTNGVAGETHYWDENGSQVQ